MKNCGKNGYLCDIWEILYPLMLYWIISTGTVAILIIAINNYINTGVIKHITTDIFMNKNIAYLNALGMLATIPFTLSMYRNIKNNDKIKNHGYEKVYLKSSLKIMLILLGVCSAFFFNMLLQRLDLTRWSAEYQNTASVQYSVSTVAGIIIYGGIAPIAEEVLFRGIIFNRLREKISVNMAIIVSSILFGIYHGNLVQAVYAFLIGLILARCYAWFPSILIPVLIHSAANIGVYLSDSFLVLSIISHPVVGGICGIVMFFIIVFFYKSKENHMYIK